MGKWTFIYKSKPMVKKGESDIITFIIIKIKNETLLQVKQKVIKFYRTV